ncbi:hypothetical protein F4810DRAFT_693681 [Camillea tinctor]|nr:hypothetical protein F4810DRAFT_693681 [Camillea tinctor]
MVQMASTRLALLQLLCERAAGEGGCFYDICLWIRGENAHSLRQSFTDIAVESWLPGAQFLSHKHNQRLVYEWLERSGGGKWLLVFVNVQNSNDLEPFWPIMKKAMLSSQLTLTRRISDLVWNCCGLYKSQLPLGNWHMSFVFHMNT